MSANTLINTFGRLVPPRGTGRLNFWRPSWGQVNVRYRATIVAKLIGTAKRKWMWYYTEFNATVVTQQCADLQISSHLFNNVISQFSQCFCVVERLGEGREQQTNALGNSISAGIAYSVPCPGHDYFGLVVPSIL